MNLEKAELKILKVKVERTKVNKNIRTENMQLLTLCIPAIVLVFVFCYLPMGGIVIAFKNFRYDGGIIGSPWVGFDNFKFLFTSSDAFRITRNTLLLNILFIIVHTVVQIAMALMLYEITKRWITKTYQTIMIIPNFVSWVIAGYMAYIFLNPQLGIINQILEAMGVDGIRWYSEPAWWPAILTISHVWKGTGMGLIVYYAALMGIDSSYFEAAEIDGATAWQKKRYIAIPTIMPIITILTILAIGNIFRADFGMFYQLTRNISLLYPTTDVIDTYVFRALREMGNVSISAAVGLFQSFVGFILVLATNYIVRRVDPDRALF